MDRKTQNLAAAALFILIPYALVYGGYLQVSFHVPFIITGFWVEIILLLALLFRVRRVPLLVAPTVIAILLVLVPSAQAALAWTAWSINGFAP